MLNAKEWAVYQIDAIKKLYYIQFSRLRSKSRDYKERQVDKKKRKVFVTAHVVLCTAAMYLSSALIAI